MSPDRISPTPTPGRARRFSLPVLVALTLVALVLGSLGTATASGLSAKAVKKIATKVVNHKAEELSVAHARTADSATTAATLQGLTATDLGTRAYVYSLPVEGSSNNPRSYGFPGLPAGTYLASYALTATMSASGGVLACAFSAPTGPLAVTSFGTPATLAVTNFLSRPAASGVLTTTAQTTLSCGPTSGAPFALTAGVANTVSFVPIRTTTAGTPTSQ